MRVYKNYKYHTVSRKELGMRTSVNVLFTEVLYEMRSDLYTHTGSDKRRSNVAYIMYVPDGLHIRLKL